jgi:hypothetical protein
MGEKRLRVALFGRFCPESNAGKSVEHLKETLRDEAKRRNYIVAEEFWEEDVPLDAALEDRPVMKRLIASIWNNELNIDGVFITELSELGWTSRKEHVVFTMLFEQNNIAIITLHECYHPDDWLAAYSF